MGLFQHVPMAQKVDSKMIQSTKKQSLKMPSPKGNCHLINKDTDKSSNSVEEYPLKG